MEVKKHLETILNHKRLVREGCFKVGLYRQGIMHDWSKYSPVEFLVGCKYYQGYMSPNNAERKEKGYSAAWLHHKGRNKHHMEYWIDYSPNKDEGICGMEMPVKYVVEMYIDRVSACKNYQKEEYTDRSPLEYYEHGKPKYILHPNTQALLEKLLTMLAQQGEDETYEYIRREVLKKKLPGLIDNIKNRRRKGEKKC